MNSGNEVEYHKDSQFEISIVYAYADSDFFYPATRHGGNYLCFATKHSIVEGEKIYIMTQDYPLDDADLKTYEGCFAKVHGCEKIIYKENQAYMVQVKLVNGMAKRIAS